MPDTTLKLAIREAYASAPVSEVALDTIEIYHPAWSAPLRLVCDHADHTLTLEASAPRNAGQAVLFVAYPFRRAPPQVNDQGYVEMTIEVDNVTREIEDALASAAISAAPTEVIWRTYLASDTSGPQNDPPITLQVISAPVGNLVAQIRCAYGNFPNRRYPSEKYTGLRFPGLVR